MKLTLLEICQLILSDMDSDEVNSISDTPESQQIAKIVKETYIDIYSRADLPNLTSFFELNPSGDVAYPTLMHLPSDVQGIEWLKYDKAGEGTNFQDIFFLDLKSFMDMALAFNTNDAHVGTNILTINGDDITISWRTDKDPTYFTTFDDSNILFDSYDITRETTLTKAHTQGWGEILPTFTLSDTFVPDLNAKQFSLLIQEAKSQAFTDLKQIGNSKAEQRARKGWLNMQRKKSQFPDTWQSSLPNYGKQGNFGPVSIAKSLRNGT